MVARELKAGDFEGLESRFDEAMKAALPDTALRVFWADTVQRAGALHGCAEPRMKTVAEFTLAFSDCAFERQRAELRLTIRPDGRLAGMFLSPRVLHAAGLDRARLRERRRPSRSAKAR